METVVIGSVPYLNALPLIRWFTDTEEGRASGVRVVEAVPSELARLLERGEIATALVSSIEYHRKPGLAYAPGVAVMADGPVRSVRMLSKVPVGEVRRVALDTSSLTSVTLLKILLAERYDLAPEYLPHPPNLTAMLAEADAGLLIGDPGYRDYGPGYHVLDLGEAWKELTGLPFAYALWIGRPSALTPELCELLVRAKEWGKANPEHIARREFERLNETYERSYAYLTEVMRYDLDARGEEALRLFGAKARAHGLIPAQKEREPEEVAA
jgi:Predicted periplasmic solute-binding protein